VAGVVGVLGASASSVKGLLTLPSRLFSRLLLERSWASSSSSESSESPVCSVRVTDRRARAPGESTVSPDAIEALVIGRRRPNPTVSPCLRSGVVSVLDSTLERLLLLLWPILVPFLIIVRATGFPVWTALLALSLLAGTLYVTPRGELPSFDEELLEATIVDAFVRAGLLAALRPDLTLTTAAFVAYRACAGGMGLRTPLSRYTVVATLLRARLDAILPGRRPSIDEASE
jgi:hypothetical protein